MVSHFPCALIAKMGRSLRRILHFSLQKYLVEAMLCFIAVVTYLWILVGL